MAGPATSRTLRSLALTPRRGSFGPLSDMLHQHASAWINAEKNRFGKAHLMKAPRLFRLFAKGAWAITVLSGVACSGPVEETDLAIASWTLSDEPIVSIGGTDEREDYLLFRVVGATRLTDGRIVIANTGSSVLKYFDSGGTHLTSVGGDGDGPGEMRNIMQLLPVEDDSLLVLSFRPGLTVFGPSGGLSSSSRIDLWGVGGAKCRIGESNWYVLSDRSILTILEDNFYGPDCPTRPSNPWRQSGLIGRKAPDSSSFDTLAIMPATERNSPNYRVYGESLVLALGPDRVYAGDTGSETIVSLNFDGDTLRLLPVPFAKNDIPSRAKREPTRQSGEEYLYPEQYPVFGRLLVARTGNLWVMAYPKLTEPTSSWRLARAFAFLVEEGGARWAVLSPEGELLGQVRTPREFFVLEVGEDYVLGVSKDETDVETVSLYALSR
jgi:hypothetical protein